MKIRDLIFKFSQTSRFSSIQLPLQHYVFISILEQFVIRIGWRIFLRNFLLLNFHFYDVFTLWVSDGFSSERVFVHFSTKWKLCFPAFLFTFARSSNKCCNHGCKPVVRSFSADFTKFSGNWRRKLNILRLVYVLRIMEIWNKKHLENIMSWLACLIVYFLTLQKHQMIRIGFV